MTKTLRLLVLFTLLPFMAATARAIDSSAGTSASTFMNLGMGSPRAQALGNAYVALADGSDALAWNPAGIASCQQREVAFSNLSWIQDYSGKYLSYVQPLGQAVIGVNFAYMSMDGFDARDANDIPQPNDTVNVNNTFGTLALARNFFSDTLSLGAGVKRISENNDGTEYSNVVFDFGAKLKFGRRVALGWALQNLGDKKEVVEIQRYGAAWAVNSFFTVTGEMSKPSDNKQRVGVGLEINLPQEMIEVGKFTFRVGYFDRDNTGKNYSDSFLSDMKLSETSKISFGCGLYSNEIFGYGAGIDFAMVPYGALGRATQIAARFQF